MTAINKIYFKWIERWCDNSVKREVIFARDIREGFLKGKAIEVDLEEETEKICEMSFYL